MRRAFYFITALSLTLLMTAPLLAQSPRQPTSSEGKTTFTNIAVVGLEATGVPSYIEMVDSLGDTYYLYVSQGRLRIASDVAAGSAASPSMTTWSKFSTGKVEVGVLVGGQTTEP